VHGCRLRVHAFAPCPTMVTAPSLPPQLLGALQKAQGELARRRFDAASATLTSVLAMAPGCAPALGMAAIAAQMQGHHDRAIACFRKALETQPNDAGLHAGLGISLFESGDIEGAVAMLRRACALAPGVASAWYNLGKALKLQVHTEEAIDTLRRALQLDPANVPARLTLADALASVGETDAAAAELRGILKAHPADAHAWFALINLKVIPLSAEDAGTLRRNFEQATGAPEDRVLFGFALARALEDQGKHAESFEVLRRANRLQRRRMRWNAAEHRAGIAAIESAFATSVPAPVDPEQGREVIFIASIPRSGSSLIEQILASHPEVEGANEITDLPRVLDAESTRRGHAWPEWVQEANAADWRRLGREYLARTARWRARKPRFTDKNLVTWKYVGAVRMMLPAARVVVVHRDPVEACLACFRQWFASGTQFAYDLDDLADYCIDFTRLTQFWMRRFPERVFDLEYEALLADPETMIRRLLDFCELRFDPACLDFHRTRRAVVSAASAAQVRQPLHRDTARAARYGRELDALRARLRNAGLTCDLP